MWNPDRRSLFLGCALLALWVAFLPQIGHAQKYGGVLRALLRDPPPDLSLHETATTDTVFSASPLYNNLVAYDYFQPVESPATLRPELAESWQWSSDGRALTIKLRQGVKWHDGKPLIGEDVKHTWDVVRGAKRAGLKLNPRKTWYANIQEIVTNGDREVTFRLKHPQPSLLSMFASGNSAVYPAHISPADLRGKPVGTGPFRLKTWIRDQRITQERNPEYFVKGRPYLDGVDFIVIRGVASQTAAMIAKQVDVAPPVYTVKPIMEQLKAADVGLVFAERVTNGTQNVIVNTKKAPLSNLRLRQAVNLALDRNSLIKTVYKGGAVVGSAMIPQPHGHWGLTPEQLDSLPGYGDAQKNKAEARKILAEEGYGPNNPLRIVVSTRSVQAYIESANWMLGEMKQVGIETTLEQTELGTWYGKVARRDFQIASNQTAVTIDDPDAQFYENFTCGSTRNYSDYCNPEMEKRYEAQSMETDEARRRRMVNEIDMQLAREVARPYLAYRLNYYAHYPYVKNWIPHISSYNSWRFQEVWLDR